jgi:Ca2+-binding EF-hand superfamily protein
MKFTSTALTAVLIVVSTTFAHTCCGFVVHHSTNVRQQQVLSSSFASAAVCSGTTASAAGSSIRSSTSSPLFSVSAGDDEDDTTSTMEIVHRDADVIFSIIDKDGNGYIDLDELMNHLKPVGYTEKVINNIFDKMDTNDGGKISRHEFQGGMVLFAALQSAPGLGNYNAEFVKEIHEDSDQVFQSVDTNGDGSIDVKELKSHLKRTAKFGNEFSDTAIDRIFMMLDVDGNKRIEKEELRDAFARYSALRQAIGEGPNYK